MLLDNGQAPSSEFVKSDVLESLSQCWAPEILSKGLILTSIYKYLLQAGIPWNKEYSEFS